MIPPFEAMLVPYLRFVSGRERLKENITAHLIRRCRLTPKEAKSVVFRKRLSWTCSYLDIARLIFAAPSNVWITAAGKRFLKKYPKSCDRFDLVKESPSFASFKERTDRNRQEGQILKRKIWPVTPNTPNHPNITRKLNRFFFGS